MLMSDKSSNTLCFFINGQEVIEEQPDPEWSLLYYLRRKLKLTGTKYGCGEGGCGACTVMVSRLQNDGSIKHGSVNACLTPVVSLHGTAVTTVEGVGSIKTKLHPLQERLAFAHGSQCGFCTPGIIMSMYALIRTTPNPTMKEIEDNLLGNLCRCTGYRPILDGFRPFSAEFKQCGVENCCQKPNKCCSESVSCCKPTSNKEETEDETLKDFIFPPKLLIKGDLQSDCIVFRGPRITWYAPNTLEDLLQIKSIFPEAKIVAGNTIVGIDAKYKATPDAIQIQATKVSELNQFQVLAKGVQVGAAMGLSDVETRTRNHVSSLPEYQGRVLRSLLEMLQWFGNKQIKNVASLGGNIITGSAVSSIMQVLLACGAELRLKSIKNERTILMDETFYLKDTKISPIKQDEVVISVFIPYTKEGEFFEVFRQTRRRANDSSIVNAGMKVVLERGPEDKFYKVADLKLAFGGVAKSVIMAPKTMMALKGLCWDDNLLQKSSSLLFEDLPLEMDTPGGSIHYRRTLILSFFLKFYLKVINQLSAMNCESGISTDETSVLSNFKDLPIQSSQLFDENVDPSMEPIGKPMIHSSGIKHTTGEAIYVDDMPLFEDELFGALVVSQTAKATIETIDSTEALTVDGVVRFICHRDIDARRNIIGFMVQDEEVFASKQVTAVGNIIGMILAKSEKAAKEGVKRVKIKYNEIKPVLEIKEAIIKGDDFKTWEISNGDVDKGFNDADHILEGEVRIGSQEHFYMEPQACIAVPKEDGDLDLYCATQNQAMVQTTTANVLGIPFSKVKVKTKRVGGAFGGKTIDIAHMAAAIAFASCIVGKPVRLTIDREVDIASTGKRHSCLGRWKVGFQNTGIISSIDAKLYFNAGSSCGISPVVTQAALLHFDSVYSIPHIRALGKPCKTNTPSGTAFRGFGIPQAMFIMEDIMTRVANALNVPQNKVREVNMHPAENPRTYFGQALPGCTIRKCWDDVLRNSDFERRLNDVNTFNRENKYHKRGIAIAPTKQTVSIGLKALSRAWAVVHIYLDGSVLLTHAAIEMGQGVHTKMIQIASKEFGISPENIYTAENSTEGVPNACPTAGSIGTDLNGMAVMNACKALNEKIAPYKEKNPDGGWRSWVNSAHANQIQLSAAGFYQDDNADEYDFEKKTGKPFPYCVYGAAVTEVEIDVLTGDHRVLRVDIVVDGGNSLNPAIDIGQIEGGYVQGYGLFTLEELIYSPTGHLRTKGPYTYKIPTVNDIPREFYVSLLRDSPNPMAIYSSKGLGEAPLILAVSAFSAIKMAIRAARTDKSPFRLDSPATSERIRMACADDLIDQAKPTMKSAYEEWSVDV